MTPASSSTEKYSRHLTIALQRAAAVALGSQHSCIEPAHILIALAETEGALSAELLVRTKLNTAELLSFLTTKLPSTPASAPHLSTRSKHRLVAAATLAYRAAHPYIGTEHVLKAILEDPGPELAAYQRQHPWDATPVVSELDMILKSDAKLPELTETFTDERTEPDEHDHDGLPHALKGFGTELTNPAHASKLDPVIGRDQEIERVMHILVRRTKNNPVLLGDPGVGKTAIVEGLAKRIADGNVHPALMGKRLLSLDVGSLIAGTMFRGEFEGRLRQVVEELKKNPDIIVFIDELHTIVGAGAASGSVDAANLLKPALARGELRCIGATTLDEYRAHIETDGALERRFQPVQINEPTPAATLDILRGLRPNYERHHAVRISDQALEAAVRLSERYVPDRFLPDKAIDLVDEAAARVRLSTPVSPLVSRLHEIEQAERLATRRKEAATARERFEEAIRWRDEAARHHAHHLDIETSLEKTPGTPPVVTDRVVAEVVRNWTGTPVREIALDQRQHLTDLDQELQQHFVGHDRVRLAVTETIRRSSLGLSDRRRPLASFLLVGGSGIGKTTLARALARVLFGDEQALLHFDMSEFAEGFTVSKLIGAPAGYVGYKESGLLTEEVRRRPYRVILFDELHHAHRDVNRLLLQILGEGTLRDATGRLINFSQTIIVATMNPGSVANQRLGFGDADAAGVEAAMLEAASRLLSNELRQRFDAVLPLLPLNDQHLETILTRELKTLNERLAEQRAEVAMDEATRNAFVLTARDDESGARRLQQLLRSTIESQLAGALVRRRTKGHTRFTLRRRGTGWRLTSS